MAEWWEELISFGAAGRIERANDDYLEVRREAMKLAKHVEKRREEANVVMQELVAAKVECIPVLAKVSIISKHLTTRDRSFSIEVAGEAPPEISMARIQSTLEAGQTAMSAAKGLAAGASTALGAWALVGTLGTASTGTAIGSLTGVAATNATLAWFGGGSLAAGGAGTAGGAAALGGVVALPALAIMAFLAHADANKKIAEIEREAAKIERAMDDMKKVELIVRLAEQRAQELTGVIGKAREAFEHQLGEARRQLFPWGFLSRAWRWLRSSLWGSYFQPSEVQEVQKVLQVAAEFARLLDQQVFDPDGKVRKS